MKTSRLSRPQINPGSMADIAFLLLIFFLVTASIPNDEGINQTLPEICPQGTDCFRNVEERNLFTVILNSKNEVMVNKEVIDLNKLKDLAINFIDNNGNDNCSYCNGSKIATLSEHPSKAVISLEIHPQSSYETFIGVQDELTKAYYELRINYAERDLNLDINNLSKTQLEILKKAYPFILSEAETKTK